MRHRLRVIYANVAGKTSARCLFETGSIRLRHSRGAGCEAHAVNTAGGILAGDTILTDVTLEAEAQVTISTVAAEKVYRSVDAASTVVTRLEVGSAAQLAWLPQETILYDRARLDRSFIVDLAADATFVACEIIQFGRVAYGEQAPHGLLHDSWRVRRGGRLVHADETRIDGAIGTSLDRRAVAAGARAVATFLLATPNEEAFGERLEATLATFRSPEPMLEGGVSVKDGILLARLLARSASDLRTCMTALVAAVPGLSLPRSWR